VTEGHFDDVYRLLDVDLALLARTREVPSLAS